MSLILELVAGGGVGAVAGELLKMMIDATEKSSSYPAELKNLMDTLTLIFERVERITVLNHNSGVPQEMEGLSRILEEGEGVVRKCIANDNIWKRWWQSEQLVDLDNDLRNYLSTILPLDHFKETKEIRQDIKQIRQDMNKLQQGMKELHRLLNVNTVPNIPQYEDYSGFELGGLDLQTGYFTLRQIKAATGNFDPGNKIGEGGFGPVYKGVLSDGVVIAVKKHSSKSRQGNREFVNEIGMISALQHPNLVRLYGCCIEGNQLLLVYEYLENNSLARALFGIEEQRLNLDWPTRKKICVGIARGLAFLHEESILKIVHRDIKATNVLLDKELNAKISDFGLAKLDEEEDTHISTRIAGTIGYMAPEYAMRGYLTDKADVYSFGVVALEIVSGKSNTNYRPKEECVYLLDRAYVLQEQGNLLELVDPILGSNYDKEGAMGMLLLGLLCTNPSPTLRPTMSSVVSMLQGKIPIPTEIINHGSADLDMRFKAFGKLSQDSQTQIPTFSVDSSQVQKSMSSKGPWIDSSVSLQSKHKGR